VPAEDDEQHREVCGVTQLLRNVHSANPENVLASTLLQYHRSAQQLHHSGSKGSTHSIGSDAQSIPQIGWLLLGRLLLLQSQVPL